MSAIVGQVNLDGQRVERPAISQMLEVLAHRGPNGRSIWCADRAGLGHALLRLDDDHPQLPLARGSVALTSDARLDNRLELRERLGLQPRSTDPEIILAAYLRWGEDCAEHFLGDFAFAIWDGAASRLYCARDHFGVKPFYYALGRSSFRFASEIKALLPVVGQPEVDDARIADFLVPMVSDNESTLYNGILRLPPHHTLTITQQHRVLRSYWRLESRRISTRNDLPEKFREIFTSAVRCRLHGTTQAGAMLSGGLDSSSISCVASRIEQERLGTLSTLSMTFDESPEWNERAFIEAVLKAGTFNPSFVPLDDYAPFSDLRRSLRIQDGIFFAPGPIGTRIYSSAAARGLRILLDGHGGDEVVSQGYGRLFELAAAGRWLPLWREVRPLAELYKKPAWRIYGRYARRYGPTRHLVKLRRQVASRLRFERSEGRNSHSPHWCRFINEELVDSTELESRYSEQRRTEIESILDEQSQHLHTLTSPIQPYMLEILDRASAAAGVESRYPFWDKRLVEFCLALPAEQKLQNGTGRLILRRAMEGALPASVQWRRDKFDFSPPLVRGMLAHHRDLMESIVYGDLGDVGRYVNLPVVSSAYERIQEHREKARSDDLNAVWRTTVLAAWLQDRKQEVAANARAASLRISN